MEDLTDYIPDSERYAVEDLNFDEFDDFDFDYQPEDNSEIYNKRVSTDIIIERVSKILCVDPKVINLELEEESGIFKKGDISASVDIVNQDLKNSITDGDVKVDNYFPGTDLNEIPHDMPKSNDFYNSLISYFHSQIIDTDQDGERLDFLKSVLSNRRSTDFVSKPSIRNDFFNMSISRTRSNERALGSLDTSYCKKALDKYLNYLVSESYYKNTDEYLQGMDVQFEADLLRSCILENRMILREMLAKISNCNFLAHIKYARQIARQLLHSATDKVKRNSFKILTGGCANALTILAKGQPIRNERSSIKFFNAYITSIEYADILMGMKGSFLKYKVFKINEKSCLLISNWYTITPKTLSLYIELEFKALSVPIYICLNHPSEKHNSIFKSVVKVVYMASISKVKEAVNFLSLFRYFSVGLLSEYNKLDDLLIDKLDRRVSSIFYGWLLKNYLSYLKKPEIFSDWLVQPGQGQLHDDIYALKFKCYLPLYKFYTDNVQDYLSEVYLVNLCSDDLTGSQHSFKDFVSTLKEYEDKKLENHPSFFCDPELIEFVSQCVVDEISGLEKFDRNRLDKHSNPLINYASPNGVLSDFPTKNLKLYDRIMREVNQTSREITLGDVADRIGTDDFKFTMVEKLQKQNPREIFKSDLTGIANLKTIESASGYINSFLFSETISYGGDEKYFRVQNMCHKLLSDKLSGIYRDEYFMSRTSDSSKWSTGDNPDSLISSFKPIAELLSDGSRQNCITYLEKLKSRKLILEDKLFRKPHFSKGKRKMGSQASFLAKAVQDEYGEVNEVTYSAGWPQGFFNKLSTYKHYLCQALSIALYKIHAFKDGCTDTVIDQCCHSDDYTYFGKFEDHEDMILWEKCLSTARRIFCIKENQKKSCASPYIREFLSFFVMYGSIYIPHVKFVSLLFKDVPGYGYTTDLYSCISRVRECYRIGVSEIWCQFGISMCQKRISEMYSMAPGMKNYDEKWCNYQTPCEIGGYFSCHPMMLLFFGSKANNLRLYMECDRKKLYVTLPGVFPFDDTESVLSNKDIKEVEGFFNSVSFHLKYQSNFKEAAKLALADRLDDNLDQPESFHNLMLFPYLNYEDAKRIMNKRLFKESGRRLYSKIPKGMIEVVVHRNVSDIVYKSGDSSYNLMQLFGKLNSYEFEENKEFDQLIEIALFSASPILQSLGNIYISEGMVEEEVESQGRNLNFMTFINLKSPGNYMIKNLNESLAMICTVIDGKLKERISSQNPDINKQVIQVRELLNQIFGVEEIFSLDELDYYMKFMNTRFPANKFLIVPDLRLIKGVNDVNLLIREMLQYRVSPIKKRKISFESITKITGWRDQTLLATDLIKSIKSKSNWDTLIMTYNMMLNPRFDNSRIVDFMKDYKDETDTSIFEYFNEFKKIAFHKEIRSSQVSRAVYYMSKILPDLDYHEFSNWYESYNPKIKLLGTKDEQTKATILHLEFGKTNYQINTGSGVINVNLRNAVSYLNYMEGLCMCQQILDLVKTGRCLPAFMYPLLGRLCLKFNKADNIGFEDLIVGRPRLIWNRCGLSGVDVVSGIKVKFDVPSQPVYNELLFNQLKDGYGMSVDFRIEVYDHSYRILINGQQFTYLSLMKYKHLMNFKCDQDKDTLDGVNLLLLLNSEYFNPTGYLKLSEGLSIVDSHSYRDEKLMRSIRRTKMKQSDIDSLNTFSTNYQMEIGFSTNTKLSENENHEFKVMDVFNVDTELEILEIDEVGDDDATYLGQKRKYPIWLNFEKDMSTLVKLKLFQNRLEFDSYPMKGLGNLVNSMKIDSRHKANEEGLDEHSKVSAQLFHLSVCIVAYNQRNLDYTVIDQDILLNQLLSKGGLSKSAAFWNSLAQHLQYISSSSYF